MRGKYVEVRRWVAVLTVALALVGGTLLAVGTVSWTGRRAFGANVPVTVSRDPSPVNLGAFSNGFAAVVKPVLPAVVNISSSRIVKNRNSASEFFNDPFFRQFFGDQFGRRSQPRPERERSLGSGVIVNPEGYILTNNHVVDGASDIKVYLNNQREYTAKLVGTDPKTDVAVLKIDASGLPAVSLGDSSKLQVGDIVFAIGDPFGVGETVTMGIVSATGRGGLGIERGGYEDFIQTDASINPGNSGGALIDLHGNVIGINTAILTGGGGGSQGVGFAIPISMAHNVMEQIVTHGKVVRGYLGVYIQKVTPELARAFGLSQGGGALVGEVTPDGPAAKAGLQKGDVILEMNGQPINDSNDLSNRVSQSAPGTEVRLKAFRDGKAHDVNVKLGELPEKAEASARSEQGTAAALEGVQVENLTPEVARELELSPSTRGVVVTSIDPASAAGEAGLQRGDIIQEVNRKPVHDVSGYEQALAGAGKQPVLLLVNRGGTTVYLAVEPHQ
jgi:serine protease Do